MKTLRSKKKLFYLLAFLTLSLVAYGAYRLYTHYQYGQYVYYEPELVMKDYAFFNDNRAIVIDWEQKDPETDAKILKTAENGVTAIEDTYRGIVVGQQYAVTTAIKLKENPSYSSSIGGGALNRNKPEKGEFWTITVYDLSDGKVTKKTYDIFGAVRAYNMDLVPSVYYNYRTSYVVDGKEYLPITLQTIDNPKLGEVAVIDLATGEIKANPRPDFITAYKSNRLKNSTSLDNYYDGKLKDGGISSHLTEEGIAASKDWRLKEANPQALKLLQNGRSYFYLLSNTTDTELAASTWELLLPEGMPLFDNLTIYAHFAVDGQDHVVNSYEEFVQYYKTTR